MVESLTSAMTEDELLQAIYDAALYLGWRVHHDRRSDLAVQQGHTGFPDLVLAKEGRMTLFLELKSEKGKTTPDQDAWLLALSGRCRTIRPADLDDVLALLR
jgi:hypothetical protein